MNFNTFFKHFNFFFIHINNSLLECLELFKYIIS